MPKSTLFEMFKSRNILLAYIMLFCTNCKNSVSISTCEINTQVISKNHIMIKIIKIDPSLYEKIPFRHKCWFFQALNVDKKDTFNLIATHTIFNNEDLKNYVESHHTLVFFPVAQDSCVTCSFDSSTQLADLRNHTYVVGTLSVLIH